MGSVRGILGATAALLLCGFGVPEHSAAVEPLSKESLERVWALTPDPQHGHILHLKYCHVCHGAQAWGDEGRAIPALAGQNEKYLLVQLMRFASGARRHPSMQEVMAHPDLNWGQAARDLAAFLSAAPKKPAGEAAPAAEAGAGARVYASRCVACHGDRAQGSQEAPALGGQNAAYLAAQLEQFALGHRGLDVPQTMAPLSARQQRNVSVYLASLSYLTADYSGSP